MVGIGENYLPAFVLAIGASQLASGLVATIPLIVGAVLQLASPYLVRCLCSYRRWVVLCAVVQALAFLPLLAGAALGSMPVLLVFALASVYWATGLAGGPAWNAWVDTLVPERLRARYFARRTRISQLGIVGGFVIGGLTLQLASPTDQRVTAFALLFLVAAISRLYSAGCLKSQREPCPPGQHDQHLGVGGLLRTLRSHTTGRALLYLLMVQTAVQISSPYFTPYMLRQLELSYAGYVVLTCTAYLAKIACLPALGRMADRWGVERLLWIGGLAIVPVAALWCLSDSFVYLCLVQVFSGAAWGAYELAMLLLFFESIPTQRRVAVLTVFNLANSTAILVGSLVGGALLTALGAGRDAYLTLFLVSSCARAVALVLLVRAPKAAIEPAPACMPGPHILPAAGEQVPPPRQKAA